MKQRLLTLSAIVMAAVAGLWMYAAMEKPTEDFSLQQKEKVLLRRSNPNKVAKAPALPQRVSSSGKQLYGWLIDCYGGNLEGVYGPTKVNASVAASDLVHNTNMLASNGVYYGDRYLAVQYNADANTVTWHTYDTSTWEEVGNSITYTSNSQNVLPSCMTWDPQTGNVYGMFFENTPTWTKGTDAHFCKVNLDDPLTPTTVIGDMGQRMCGMAAAGDGTIYGLGLDGNLYTINKLNGSVTLLGAIAQQSVGESPWYWFYNTTSSAVCEWESGMIFYSYMDEYGDPYVARIDPSTRSFTIVGNYGYEGTETYETFTGLYFEQAPAAQAQGTPVAPTAFTVTPNGAQLEASFSFTMPTLDTDGETLTADLSYEIADGTSTVASGTAAPGAQVTGTIAETEDGRYTFALTVRAGDNVSQPVTTIAFVGPDTPVISGIPGTIPATDGKSCTILLPAPTALMQGNLAEPITYEIKRFPDEVTVATAAVAPSYTDTPESPYKTEYYYTVTPKAGSKTGETVETRRVILGQHFAIPYSEQFETQGWFNAYPALDANNDGNTWWYHTGFKAAAYSAGANNADDYMCMGPFNLEAGSQYTFSFQADVHNVNEQIACYVGTDPTDASTFSTCIVPVTTINPYFGKRTLSGKFIPETSGLYYFGVKACSSSNSTNLYFYGCTLTVVGAENPKAPTAGSFTSDGTALTLTCTLPSQTFGGQAASLTSVRVMRSGQLLKEVTDGVADGAQFTFTDPQPGQGQVVYTFVPVNAAGEGDALSITAWAGLDIPGSPTNFVVKEDLQKPGLMHMTWDAPTRGIHGGYINPSALKYNLEYSTTNMGGGSIPQVISARADYDLGTPDKQGAFSVSVWAENSAGTDRTTWNTKSCYYGEALPLPLRESWAGMKQSSGIWVGQSLVEFPGLFESYWDIVDGSITWFDAQDADGGMLACSTTINGLGQRIRAPRVSLEGAENPTLIFYYRYTDKCSYYFVELAVDDRPFTVIKALDVNPANAKKWLRAEVDLSAYKNAKYVQAAFVAKASVASEEFAALDNVTISDFVHYDLEAISLKAPLKAAANAAAPFTLKVRNNGAEPVAAADYSVIVYKNGEEAFTLPGVAIDSDATADIDFTLTPLVTDTEGILVKAEISYNPDQRPANNEATGQSTRVVIGDYPTATNIQGTDHADGGILLTWDDPDASQMPDIPTTETWENYEAFTTQSVGGWTFLDRDGKPTAIMAMPLIGTLDYPHIGEPMAWQVFDPDQAGVFLAAWYARSGKQMLCSFQACENGSGNVQSDDWLISPLLSGKAQTVSFYACTATSTYSPEVFDFKYSTTTTDPEAFTNLEKNVQVPYNAADWTEFSFRLPAGAKYFAIVHKSTGQFAMMIDDVTYVPAGAQTLDLQLQGFNVYRNKQQINSTVITENEYHDAEVQKDETHTYHVSAVWDKGEAPLSQPLELLVGSVQGVGLDKVTVAPLQGAVLIKGGSGQIARVFSLSGQLVGQKRMLGETRIEVPAPGIYMVSISGQTFKLIVK